MVFMATGFAWICTHPRAVADPWFPRFLESWETGWQGYPGQRVSVDKSEAVGPTRGRDSSGPGVRGDRLAGIAWPEG